MDKKVVLITGAGGGIGYAIAKILAQNDFDIVLNYRTKNDDLEDLVTSLESFGVKVLPIQADVTNESEVEKMFQSIKDTFGKLDVTVNNAGITKDTLLLRMSFDDFKSVVDVNLNSVFLVTKASVKLMGKKGGKIINMSSIVGHTGNSGQANYAASKSALYGFSKTVAKEYASRNITCNCISPGFIKTKMTNKLSEEILEKAKSHIPLNRLGDVEDVAKLALFLASDGSDYITGQNFLIDGGMSL